MTPPKDPRTVLRERVLELTCDISETASIMEAADEYVRRSGTLQADRNQLRAEQREAAGLTTPPIKKENV